MLEQSSEATDERTATPSSPSTANTPTFMRVVQGVLFDLDDTLVPRGRATLVGLISLIPFYRSISSLRRFCALAPDKRALLDQLRRDGYRLGLVSNGRKKQKQRIIKALELTPRMDTILISSALNAKKPDPDVFRQAASDLKLAPTQILFVGDSVHADMQGAHTVGMATLLICPERPPWRQALLNVWGALWHGGRHRRKRQETVDREARSLLELRDVLGLHA